MSKVTLIETDSRKVGVGESLKAMGEKGVKNKDVLIKPNFNTADPTPGSTHNDTLIEMVDQIWKMGAKSISVGERSYPLTREVMEKKGIIPALKDKDVQILDFDELPEADWVAFHPKNSHWKTGFRIARPIVEAECLISTCCLKTHQFGGVFTLSLKLHVGVVPTSRNGFPYMSELHQSPFKQEMIAEINQPFSPDLILLDGIDAFVDGGPATGQRAKGNLFLCSRDRVAIDAVGVAVLKHLGSNPKIMTRKIFEQRQIARAAELGIGVTSAADIDLVALNKSSTSYRDNISAILETG
jgi:uncharacterized protein (DUF362 family)